MKIIMQTTAAAMHGSYTQGKEYDVADEIGADLIRAGHAKAVEVKPKAKPQAPPAEKVTMDAKPAPVKLADGK